MQSTLEVLDHHLICYGQGDLDGIMSDYLSSSVLFTPDQIFKGPHAIRTLFEKMFAEFAKPGASFVMHTKVVDGEYAFIVWAAETADNVYEMGTDTFFVRDGKIVAQTYAGKLRPKK